MSSKRWREQNKDKIKECNQAWYKNNKEHVGKHYTTHRQEILKKRFVYGQISKYKVLSHYCQGEPHCQCPSGKCPESVNPHFEFLSIDHIGGGGNKERRRLFGGKNSGGLRMYVYLIKHKYPKGYRVLCFNCNQSLSAYGYCPHHK